MRFTVTATPQAEAGLTTLFLNAPDPQAVTEAANWIDRELANNPISKATPVDNLYFLRRHPLVALCEISVDDRLVTVIEFRLSDK